MVRVVNILWLCLCFSSPIWGWNSVGHQLIAEIAYLHLNEQTKTSLGKVLEPQGGRLRLSTFKQASIWMDLPKNKRNPTLKGLHYTNWPLSFDLSWLPAIEHWPNAQTALEQAFQSLKDGHLTPDQKALFLKIYIHVLGDIHQPLHTTSLISSYFLDGDKGGGLFEIVFNQHQGNLHQFWDEGGGWLKIKKNNRTQFIHEEAQALIQEQACLNVSLGEKIILRESHMIAITKVYGEVSQDGKINQTYLKMTQHLAKQQIYLAGCRLAKALSQLA